jgi:hypothetical protein
LALSPFSGVPTLDAIAAAEEAEITINVGENLKFGNNTGVVVGQYDTAQIDMADIAQLPAEGGPSTQASAMAHEVVEQYFLQVQGLMREMAHENGLAAEDSITGFTWQKPEFKKDAMGGVPGQYTKTFSDPKTGKVTYFTIYWDADGKITNVNNDPPPNK